jgi:hypothetical protein
MIARRVDDALLHGFADDLADAPGRQPLLARDRGTGPAFPDPRENARPPDHSPPLLNHAKLAFPDGQRRSINREKQDSTIFCKAE